MGSKDQGVICAPFDFELIRQHRAAFGFFRDRRPDCYEILTTS
jgi:N-carbamoylputrescine amidase